MLPGLFRRHRPRTRAEIKELFKPENNVIPMSDWWTYVRPPSPEPEPLIQLPLTILVLSLCSFLLFAFHMSSLNMPQSLYHRNEIVTCPVCGKLANGYSILQIYDPVRGTEADRQMFFIHGFETGHVCNYFISSAAASAACTDHTGNSKSGGWQFSDV